MLVEMTLFLSQLSLKGSSHFEAGVVVRKNDGVFNKGIHFEKYMAKFI